MFCKHLFNTDILENVMHTQDLNDNFSTIAPKIFLYDKEGPRSLKVSKAFKELYFKNQPLSNATAAGLGQVCISTIHMIAFIFLFL